MGIFSAFFGWCCDSQGFFTFGVSCDDAVGQDQKVRLLDGTYNLSVNNVDAQLYLSERNDGRCQMVEGKKAAVKFFVSHQQFAEAVEPTVCHFDNPTPGLLLRVTLEFAGLLSWSFDMRYVAVLLDNFQGRCTGITTSVSAQVLVRL